MYMYPPKANVTDEEFKFDFSKMSKQGTKRLCNSIVKLCIADYMRAIVEKLEGNDRYIIVTRGYVSTDDVISECEASMRDGLIPLILDLDEPDYFIRKLKEGIIKKYNNCKKEDGDIVSILRQIKRIQSEATSE